MARINVQQFVQQNVWRTRLPSALLLAAYPTAAARAKAARVARVKVAEQFGAGFPPPHFIEVKQDIMGAFSAVFSVVRVPE
ncbi:MAG: hypothetical protein F9K41_00075 [Sphingopyxis terrae]|nr:MAG: hypothetical protein F9K41_00075 [Sphingopyxis terrae]